MFMKPVVTKSTWIFLLLITFIIGSSLIISHLFYYVSLTPFLFFIQGISLLIVFTGLIFFSKKDINRAFTIPHLLTILFALYILINGLYIAQHYNSYHTYLLFCCGLLLVLSVLLNAFPSHLYFIHSIILIMALLEALLCVGQWAGLLDSQSHFFKVTGTWENPNVTAMFIAIALPALFSVKAFYRLRRITLMACLFVLCFALILLDCRTAWISIALIAAIYGNKRYGLLKRFGTLNNVYKAIICLSVIVLVTFAGIWLYQHKKSSANGRLLIWKISAQMISQKPITGFGYGLFEREYNLFQANYFNHHQGNILEKANAGFVHMAYNEFLQNTVEGGIIGLALLCAIFCYLLKPISFKDEDKEEEAYRAAYWGIWVFILMSLINFTIQAIPVMCVLLIYGAMLASSPYQRLLFVIHANHQHKTSRLKYIGVSILLVGIWLTFPYHKSSGPVISINRLRHRLMLFKYLNH